MEKLLLLTAVTVAGLSALAYTSIHKIFADGEFDQPLPHFFWGPNYLQGQTAVENKIYPFTI